MAKTNIKLPPVAGIGRDNASAIDCHWYQLHLQNLVHWSGTITTRLALFLVVITLMLPQFGDEIGVKPTHEIDRDLRQHGGGIYD